MLNHDLTSDELILIERYLQNELAEDELADFTSRTENDPVFPEKVASVRLMLLAIREAAVEDKLDLFHQRMQEAQKPARAKSISLRYFAVAASIALILSLSVWFLLIKENKAQDLYSAYYKPDPGLMTVMSTTDRYDFEKAMVAYRNGEYDQAVHAWSAQLKNDPASDTLAYFLGAAYQAMGKADSASIYLARIAEDTGSSFYSDAHWYLALIQLRAGRQAEARSHLEHSIHARAAELIQKLEK